MNSATIAHEDPQTRLTAINDLLAARKLKQLRKLGNNKEGETEVLAILEIYDHSARFFTDVKFSVRFPDGKQGEFTVRFNANGEVSDGSVIVVIINGKFAIVKQWRLPLCQWTYEVPRGFCHKLDQGRADGQFNQLSVPDLPLGIIIRELGQDLMAAAQIKSITHLGDIAENSGTSSVVPGYYLVSLSVDPDKLQNKTGGTELKVALWDGAQVQAEFGGKLRDSHTLTALALAQRHINSLPKL